VQVADAFRIDGRFTHGRNRPVLVNSSGHAWDRRIIISGAHKLVSDDAFRGRVYINADEPLQTRRRNTLERLKAKAERDGKDVLLSPDRLLCINNVPVFSLNSGFIRANEMSEAQIINTNG
jgi:hypothetical protein